MEIAGKIKWIDETKTYGTNGFRKREVVVTTEEQYPQHILVEFIQDKCDLLNAILSKGGELKRLELLLPQKCLLCPLPQHSKLLKEMLMRSKTICRFKKSIQFLGA